MTYEEYITNPMGGKNAVFAARDMYKKMYTEKWDKLIVRENGVIKIIPMKSKTDYYVYIKIPSEVVPKFYYDVVVRFYPPKDKTVSIQQNLKNYDVQFFSNDPSFVFTFAHAFKKHGMFLDDLALRMSKEALKFPAKERNPSDSIGYVKSLYFAYLVLKEKGYFSKAAYNTVAPYDKKGLLASIEDADEKINERQKKAAKLQKQERQKKNVTRETKRGEGIKKFNERQRGMAGNVHVTSPTTSSGGRGSMGHGISKISGKSKITGKRKT